MHTDSHFIVVAILSFCCLLLVLSVTKHYAKNSLIPADAWVLIIGLIYGLGLRHLELDTLPTFSLNPDVIILVLLPLLIFSSGRLIDVKDLKPQSLPIGFFATAGVVATTFLIGVPLSYVLGIPIIHGLLLGAAASATDPAAVASIFHNFTIEKSLEITVEGESLFNDGTTVVLFGLLSSILFSNAPFIFLNSFGLFMWAILAALPLGFILGRLGAFVINQWQERHASFDISISLIIAYLSFLIAEKLLHASGVITVLVTAIIFYKYCNTSVKAPVTIQDKTEDTSNSITNFWEYIALVANGILFFSLGATTGLHDFSEVPTIAVVVGVVSVVIARCIIVYGGAGLLCIVRYKLALKSQNILVLGGLRGAVSAALILMIPHDYPYRDIFLCVIVAIIIFTLIVQPIALKYYLNKDTVK